MKYTEAATKATIEVRVTLTEQYKIENRGPANEFLHIKILHNGTGISLAKNAIITTIFRPFGMMHTHGVSSTMDPNVKPDLAEDRGEKELNDSTDDTAVAGSLMYAEVATGPDTSYAVTALCRYNSRPFSSHMTAAMRVLQYPKSSADFGLHFIHNGINIGNSFVVYSDSVWASDSADHKSQGGHVFFASTGAIS